MENEIATYIAKCRAELAHPRKGKARTKAFQKFLKEEIEKENRLKSQQPARSGHDS